MMKFVRPTQDDVARLAGITRVTVNRALVDHPAVSAATKARVREIAERIGYRTHMGARAIREGRYGCITLAVGNAFHATYLPSTMLTGVYAGAAQHGYKLSLNILSYQAATDGTDDQHIEDVLSAFATDGLVIDHSSTLPPPLYPLVQRHRIPAIWLNHRDNVDCVAPDDAHGAAWATRTLLEHGHTRIAFIAPERDAHHSVTYRWLGFNEAMQAAGCAPQRIALPAGAAHAQRHLAGLLRRPGAPTAFLAYERHEAEVLLLALTACKLCIPRDRSLAVISSQHLLCGGIDITTFVIPFDSAGHRCVDLLVQKIADPAQSFPLTLEPYQHASPITSIARPRHR